ncbi:protein EVI2A [Coturnix japonica]|uniref:Ecotropic viral integration site 2A n=1 Tax=Coturnix japonica TaxID=93934 RepID=A0A8C2UA70_COTJA|nr:protein EVI2A [Coturnix japonica]XP_015736595.1 protein EVI2A [Coturnix japonica]
MKTKRHGKPHSAFPLGIIFSLCLQISANHTDYPRVSNEIWYPICQNLTCSQNITEDNTTSLPGTDFNGKPTPTAEMQTATPQSLSSTMDPNSSTSSSAQSVPSTGGPRNTSKPKMTMTKETCEDNKFLILICFIIIAALVLICTFLFLSTIVMANKLSYLKKAQQEKRRPRSNGDILATNSFWPSAAGTWQRIPKETTGTDLVMQDLLSARDAAVQTKTQDESTESYTKDTDNKHENKGTMSHKSNSTHFVVEI